MQTYKCEYWSFEIIIEIGLMIGKLFMYNLVAKDSTFKTFALEVYLHFVVIYCWMITLWLLQLRKLDVLCN